jgi:polysaccharide chain length determinant protein (PEP-CTERM system associated)
VLPGKTRKPEDVLWMVWRRKWTFLLPFGLIFAATVVVTTLLPDRYRSETVILVVPQRVPESYVRSTVTMNLADRLRSIQQQIQSRTRLEMIIRDFDLYPLERATMAMEDVVAMMRRDVQVEIVKGDTFRVSYTSGDPKKAMQVADRLASEYTSESMQDRAALATATTSFLQSQLDEARRRLAEQESRIAAFKQLHAGTLPSERDPNLAVMHNLELQIQSVVDAANRDRDRRLLLERSLADAEADFRAGRFTAAGTAGDAGAASPGPLTTADELENARASLKQLELRLKPEHPDVVYTKRLIQELETKAAAEAAQPAAASSRPVRGRAADEAAAQRRIKEIRDSIASLDVTLASRQAEEKRLRDEILGYQSRISATPSVEAELTALTRDYETVRKGYEDLLAKQEESKVAGALEQRQIGEVFRVIDRARLPESPVSPKRFRMNLAGALAGLLVGFSLVAFLDYRDNGLRSEDDVLSVLSLPVLASIPWIETAQDRRRRQRQLKLGIASAAAVIMLLVGAGAAAWRAGLLNRPLRFW